MNIGQLVRGLLGESSGSGDTRKLELKPGQVVRGVVLQLLENNEATVQINGVQVRAFLELPLEPGKFAMLQVQPQSAGGLLVLKQVENQAGLEDVLKDWLKQSGLPDQEWAGNILKELRKDGVTMSRDTFAALKAATETMPQGADPEQWMQAAAAGLKRGLPMSGGTIGALQQVMFGRPAHELLDSLQQQLAAIAGEASGDGDAGAAAPRAGGSTPQALPQLAARLAALLAEGAALQSAA
ncbi:DNA ligase, partial [Paenibacillus sp. ATY16]|nr:DNA ligase [Paenibacillus sp. ATY16]